MARQSQSPTAARIRQWAKEYQITYVPKRRDALAHDITRLAGDHVELDEVEQLLMALQRQGHLSRREMVRLQARYLRESKS